MSNTVLRATEVETLDGLELAEPDCIAEDFGGEVVVLNSASGVYYSLTDLAAAVWRDLLAGHSVASLLAAVRQLDPQAAQATTAFIRDLEASGILRPTQSRKPSAAASESAALVTAGETRLTMQSFDDMKDLILADPIHDVDDEMGWPVLRREEDE
jgi:hypothetical protein